MIDCLTGGGRGHFQEFSVKRQFANVFLFRQTSSFFSFFGDPRPLISRKREEDSLLDVGGKEGKGGGGGGVGPPFWAAA